MFAVENFDDETMRGRQGRDLHHLVFHAPGHDQRRFLELFERDLALRLRALG
ncbi:hypothetical protein ACFVWF_30450 [Rhodococcus qingshengii]|uniref:hypothetical protein n=1 Tax=Rhodococcus qingshengii TaxID=334542 RepID=UPI0036DD4929